MIITSIQQTTPGRMTILLDNGEVINSTLVVTTDLLLYSGKELDESGLSEIKTASVRSLAVDKSIEYISRKMMSAHELKKKLIEKGHSEDTADYCVDKLTQLGLINDFEYAKALASHYANRGYGPARIKNELIRHGIHREYYDEILEDVTVNEDRIKKIISMKLKDPTDRAQLKKTIDALYRRGFSWDEIKSAISNYTNSIEEYQ